MSELSAGTFMEIAKDNKSIVRQGILHNYMFDSKGVTNIKSCKEKSLVFWFQRKLFFKGFLSYFSPAAVLNV